MAALHATMYFTAHCTARHGEGAMDDLDDRHGGGEPALLLLCMASILGGGWCTGTISRSVREDSFRLTAHGLAGQLFCPIMTPRLVA